MWLYDVTSSPALSIVIEQAGRLIDADVRRGSLARSPAELHALPWEDGIIVHDFRPALRDSLRWLDRACVACPAGATVFGLLEAPASSTIDELVRARHRFTLSGMAIASEIGVTALADSFLAAVRHGADARIVSLLRSAWHLDPTLTGLVDHELAAEHTHTTLGGLLRDAGVDRKRFVRAARRAGFDPPLRFFQALRLVEAATLLKESLTLEQIAHRLSYGGSRTLARHFRKRTGLTSHEARGESLEALALRLANPPGDGGRERGGR